MTMSCVERMQREFDVTERLGDPIDTESLRRRIERNRKQGWRGMTITLDELERLVIQYEALRRSEQSRSSNRSKKARDAINQRRAKEANKNRPTPNDDR
jgi:phosphoenolpyruvate synthase/pyruvate phosphate dikinase